MKLEVWLLHPGGNPDPAEWQAHLQAQLAVPEALTWPKWLQGLLKWFLLRWRSKRSSLAQMSAPCPSLSLIPSEAAELERLLGPPFRCRSLQYFGPHSIDSALSATPKQSTIFLLPLHFVRGLILQQLLEQSRHQLRKASHRVQDLDFKLLQSAYVDSLSMAIRAQLIENAWTQSYGILLLLPPQPQDWSQTPQLVLEEAQLLMKLLKAKLQANIPIALAQPYGKPSVDTALTLLGQQSVTQLLISPLGSLLSDGELDTFVQTRLKDMAESNGFTTCELSMPSYRTSFLRAARTEIYNSAKGLSF